MFWTLAGALVLPPVCAAAASVELEAVAERIRRRAADLRVEISTPDGPLTVSGLTVPIGVAVGPAEGADLRTLLQIADTALSAAKRAGRNVVRTGTPPGSVPPSRPAKVVSRLRRRLDSGRRVTKWSQRTTPMCDHSPPDMPFPPH